MLAPISCKEHADTHGNSWDGLAVDATSKNICVTCQVWGGMRKIFGDEKKVIAQSMSGCNNWDSSSHQKLTPADHEMKRPDIWKSGPRSDLRLSLVRACRPGLPSPEFNRT